MIRRLVVAVIVLAGFVFVMLDQATVAADPQVVAGILLQAGGPPHDPSPVDATCVSCHDAHNARSDCTSCHAAPHVASSVDATCVSCHDAHNERSDCTSCHAAPHVASSVDATCATCHEVTHAGGVACSTCHADIHGLSDESDLGCGSCHDATHADGVTCWACHVNTHGLSDDGNLGCNSCHDATHAEGAGCDTCHESFHGDVAAEAMESPAVDDATEWALADSADTPTSTTIVEAGVASTGTSSSEDRYMGWIVLFGVLILIAVVLWTLRRRLLPHYGESKPPDQR